MNISHPTRSYVAEDFSIEKWADVEKYLIELNSRKITTLDEFQKWLKDKSEFEAIISENLAWRYIKMTINTKDEKLAEAYTFFIRDIQPKLAPYDDKLNKKLIDCSFRLELEDDAHRIYFRSIETALKLFREENISIQAEIAEKSQQFSVISGGQSIEHEGKEITMQKAGSLLKVNEEKLRKSVFDKMALRRQQDVSNLDKLFSELVQLRHRVAVNAGFKNYRDYKFEELGRFDYTKEDCFAFHRAIKEEVVPLVKQFQENQAKQLKKTKLKPWDTEVDPLGREALKPFESGEELLEKSIAVFNKIDPYFGDCLKTMEDLSHLDLESKEGKSPGGYNYPLYEIGVPFIFMNAVGTHRDLVTMVHEGGHAVHSFLTKDLHLSAFKSLPSEVAELASMSMELFTMEHWDVFYTNSSDLKRAKKEQLETMLKILPWIATIDLFQHWIYENPKHSIDERNEKWLEITESYGTGTVDWTGYEHVQKTLWQRQLHLFEVPFYYIEYGMAQLGALAMWKNSKSNHIKTISDYKKALSLGYTKSIPEIYNTAGITFDFTKKNIKSLVAFVKDELSDL